MHWQTEKDIDILRQMTGMVIRENDLLHAKLAQLAAALDAAHGAEQQTLALEIENLKEKLALRQKALFGKSSEKQKDAETKPEKPERAPQPGHGPTPQPKLPIVEKIHELDDADKICTACGGGLKPMNGQFEESEEIDVVQRSFVVVKHKRQKYGCKCGGCVDTALGPDKLIAGGRYSIEFAAHVAGDKYLDHAALTRQATQMRRQGLDVSDQTLWDQLDALAKRCKKSYEALRDYILTGKVVGADETRWPMLDGSQKTWWAWSIAGKNCAWYRIAKSRSHEEAGELLGDFHGTVMSDAYSAYEALRNVRLKRGQKAFLQAHCWAHSRRRYVQAAEFHPEAKEMVRLIGELYAIEAKAAKAHELGTDEWRKYLTLLRQTESKATLAKIRTWANTARARPTSALGRAISYMTDNWRELGVFVDEVEVPLDNNDTERGIRGLACGRKIHYGSKSERGTEVAAIFYSLCETCKRLGVDAEQYLAAVARADIASPGAVLMPHQFAAMQNA